MHKACPKKYKFQYVDKIKPAIPLNTRPFLEGGVTHTVLERAYNTKKPLTREAVQFLFPAAWDYTVAHQLKQGVITFFPTENMESVKQKSLNIILEAVDFINFLGITNGTFFNEYEFGAWNKPYDMGEGLKVHGKADHVSVFDNGLKIYDYKTSKNMDYVAGAQVVFYGIMMEKILKKSVLEVGFIMFQMKKVLTVPFTLENKEKVLQGFLDTSKAIDAGKFDATPGKEVCKDCVFRLQCPDSVAKKEKMISALPEMGQGAQVISLGDF
jgi:CRISPR/Cas system-associated exonuclease Cas4 (RecB family)